MNVIADIGWTIVIFAVGYLIGAAQMHSHLDDSNSSSDSIVAVCEEEICILTQDSSNSTALCHLGSLSDKVPERDPPVTVEEEER